ncbi:MAG: DUF3168 domain-containing protein [Candidatus Obscuribacterales bacterium]|nr:DUF3168 domain-containing protein [Candidatus Obscuribacterales bacterium]
MSLEAHIFQRLSGDGQVRSIASDRIYPIQWEQNLQPPAVVYQIISKESNQSHDGPDGLATSHVQFNCIAKDYDTTVALKEAVRLSLQGYTGTLEGTEIQSCECENDFDDDFSSDAELYRRILILAISHDETQR